MRHLTSIFDQRNGHRTLRANPKNLPLHIERLTTSDLADGQPQPPVDNPDIIWWIVHRAGGVTQWRKIALSRAKDWRSVSGDQTSTPTKKE
jgi:hypothetical protein